MFLCAVAFLLLSGIVLKSIGYRSLSLPSTASPSADLQSEVVVTYVSYLYFHIADTFFIIDCFIHADLLLHVFDSAFASALIWYVAVGVTI